MPMDGFYQGQLLTAELIVGMFIQLTELSEVSSIYSLGSGRLKLCTPRHVVV